MEENVGQSKLMGREVVTKEGSVPWTIVAVGHHDGKTTVGLSSKYDGRTRRRYNVRLDLLRHPYTREPITE
jgi:hypothetical protein